MNLGVILMQREVGWVPPECPECVTPMVLTSYRSTQNGYGVTAAEAEFVCTQTPIQRGHVFSWVDPDRCVRCNERVGLHSLLPCTADRPNRHPAITFKLPPELQVTYNYYG